jgi:putative transposase
VVKTNLRLSERTSRCDECPLVLDRDLNAARTLAALVGEVIGGTSFYPELRGHGKRA